MATASFSRITVDSKFDSGNGVAESIAPGDDGSTRITVRVHPDACTDLRSWFNFRIAPAAGSQFSIGQSFTVDLLDFSNHRGLLSADHRPVVRIEAPGGRWQPWYRIPASLVFTPSPSTKSRGTLTMRFTVDAPCLRCQFAYFYPYPHDEVLSALAALDTELGMPSSPAPPSAATPRSAAVPSTTPRAAPSPPEGIYYAREVLTHSLRRRPIHLVTISSLDGVDWEGPRQPRLAGLFPCSVCGRVADPEPLRPPEEGAPALALGDSGAMAAAPLHIRAPSGGSGRMSGGGAAPPSSVRTSGDGSAASLSTPVSAGADTQRAGAAARDPLMLPKLPLPADAGGGASSGPRSRSGRALVLPLGSGAGAGGGATPPPEAAAAAAGDETPSAAAQHQRPPRQQPALPARGTLAGSSGGLSGSTPALPARVGALAGSSGGLSGSSSGRQASTPRGLRSVASAALPVGSPSRRGSSAGGSMGRRDATGGPTMPPPPAAAAATDRWRSDGGGGASARSRGSSVSSSGSSLPHELTEQLGGIGRDSPAPPDSSDDVLREGAGASAGGHATGRGGAGGGGECACAGRAPRPHAFVGKPAIFVSARVHPGETPASFALDGVLALLASRSDPRAAALRRLFVFLVRRRGRGGEGDGLHRPPPSSPSLDRSSQC